MRIDNLRVGDLIAFQIGQRDGWSAPNKDRWGVIKVLHIGERNAITVSVLDGLSEKCPSPLSVRFRRLLQEKRFKGNPRALNLPGPETVTSLIDERLELEAARIIGHERIFRACEKVALVNIQKNGFGKRIAHIERVAIMLDHEDRAINDAERWQAEIKLDQGRWRLHLEKTEHRRRTRLRDIRLEALLAETQFSTWDSGADSMPTDFTARIRGHAKLLITDLASLGPKPQRPKARKLLVEFVVWVNEFDFRSNYIIATEQRDDLMQFLEEVCWSIKQKPLLAEIDAQRNW